MTNGDNLRSMTDEELADWLCDHFNCYKCPCMEEHRCMTHRSLEEWLKQESEDTDG